MTQSNAHSVADLIRASVAGKPMPETIKTADRAAVEFDKWLAGRP